MAKKLWTGLLAAIGMLVLILDSKTALAGGIDGLRMCFLTVIPALLPFFVLSMLLTSSLSGLKLQILKPLGRLCAMPCGSEPLLLLGLLGGYPTGAQAVYQAYRGGQLNKKDARRLLGFCSNAGPSFLFGIAAAAFHEPWIPWILWLIHILSAILTGALLPGHGNNSVMLQREKSVTLTQAIERSVKIMSRVCAWIILFRIFLAFCDRWFLWFFPSELQVVFSGVLELANGCLQLSRIQSTDLRFLTCSAILSLGGLSVAMQTLSVTGELGLGLYLPGKLLQCALSVCLSYLIIKPMLLPSVLFLAFLLFFLLKRKIGSRNSRKVIV